MPNSPLPAPTPPKVEPKPNTPGSAPTPAAASAPPTAPVQPKVPVTPPAPGAPVSPPSPAASRLGNPVPGQTPIPGAPVVPAAPVIPPTSGVPKVPAGLSREAPGGAAPPPPPPPQKPVSFRSEPGLSQPNGKGPVIATPKKLPLALIAGIAGVLLIGIVVVVALLMNGGNSSTPSKSSSGTKQAANNSGSSNTNTSTEKPSKQITLTYWGLWEPTEVLANVLKDYETQHPGVKIDYRKQSHKDYRERLQTAIAAGQGPDIYRYHASWVPMLKDELSPLPSKVMSVSEYKSTFYPIAYEQLQHNGQIVGIPLMYEGLGLFYNKEMLKTAGVEPPTTWTDLQQLANDLTVPAQLSERNDQSIQRAGLAIGNTTNVEHYADILALLIYQNGGDPAKPASTEVRDALLFYTKLLKEDHVWSNALPSSTVAFAKENVAMMFAPSWRVHDIHQLNPDLDFGVAPVPQLSNDKIAWATYWAEGVNSKSQQKDEAWEFLKYLSSKEVLQKLYADQSQFRAFGEIYPRQDMAELLAGDELVGAYIDDAPYAKGWYLSSYTHDNGINDQIIKYYEDAINAVATGQKPEDVVMTVDQGTKQILRQYGVTSNK